MSGGLKKDRIQFRCRAIRSSSCSNQQKTTGNTKENIQNEKRIVLNVPKKVLRIRNNSRQSLKIEQKQDVCHLKSLQSSNCYLEEADHESQSKATMKKQNALAFSNLSIHSKLAELSDSQQQMMAMLKYIIDRDYSRMQSSNVDNFYNSTQCQLNPFRKRSSQENSINTNFKITQAYNQQISVSSIKNEGKSLQTGAFRGKIPSYVANILVQVLTQRINYNPIINSQMDIRQLISRRFQAFYLTYDFFIESLIRRKSKHLSQDEIKTILTSYPFFLQRDQTDMVLKTLCHPNTSKSKQNFLSVSDIIQNLRSYFYKRTNLPEQTATKLKILQLKSIISTKNVELQQSIKASTNLEDFIDLEELEKILHEWRFEKIQIQIISAGLCVFSKSVKYIPWKMLFNEKWVKGIGTSIQASFIAFQLQTEII